MIAATFLPVRNVRLLNLRLLPLRLRSGEWCATPPDWGYLYWEGGGYPPPIFWRRSMYVPFIPGICPVFPIYVVILASGSSRRKVLYLVTLGRGCCGMASQHPLPPHPSNLHGTLQMSECHLNGMLPKNRFRGRGGVLSDGRGNVATQAAVLAILYEDDLLTFLLGSHNILWFLPTTLSVSHRETDRGRIRRKFCWHGCDNLIQNFVWKKQQVHEQLFRN
jgi:hypothetical protein